MRVTLKDIAQHTGTAISTVSAALNGTGRVSKDKVRYIRAAAEELGFQPNLAAQLLKNNDVEILGLVVTGDIARIAGHGVYSELQETFLAECHADAIRTQFEINRSNDDIPAMFLDGIAKGILHAGVINPALTAWLQKNPQFPFVSFEEIWNYCVRTNFEVGVYRAVQYLAATGHKRIGLFCGPRKFDISQQMYRGFITGCRDFGQELRPDLVKHHSISGGEEHQQECLANLREFFAGEVKPDAIISAGQCFSAVALYELPKLGYQVPEDISLIGTCAPWEAIRTYPGLCSIERNMPLLVSVAVKILKQLIRGIEPTEPQLLIPADLTIRATAISRF